ncbi:MAG: hypothetical protein KC994_25445, partial [Candidatus Omnitrophica bacterium]|nr:hypothetical protein [Candidatus Omnitrophota bacterium]
MKNKLFRYVFLGTGLFILFHFLHGGAGLMAAVDVASQVSDTTPTPIRLDSWTYIQADDHRGKWG